VDDIVARITHNLIGRLDGPMTFRLILQPIMAGILAARDGFRDARQGCVPYGWLLVTDGAARRLNIRDGWRSIRGVFFLALLVDVINQLIELRWVYPGEALIVAEILALAPYIGLRGISNRAARLWLRAQPARRGRGHQ